MVAGMICAVVRERGVRTRHLEQRRRQPVAIGHGRLLDGLPALPGPQPAGHRTGEGDLRLLAIAQRGVDTSHISLGVMRCEILSAPTLLDFWITPSTVSTP
jgi:hypothetical protein